MKLIVCLLTLLPALLCAQNSAVRWSCFDMGFARSSAAAWEVRSALGQNFVSGASSGNTKITSGFLADTLLRGPLVSVPENGVFPEEFALRQNYPNPFNPTTTIQFTIVNRQLTTVKVYDILGREVATLVNEVRDPGLHGVTFDATGLASGAYFYRIVAGDNVAVKKMLILK
jgi:hypothetical protein